SYRHRRSLPSFPTRRSSDLFAQRRGGFLHTDVGLDLAHLEELNVHVKEIEVDLRDLEAGIAELQKLLGLVAGLFQIGEDPVEQRSEEHTSELQSQSNLVCRL